MTIGKRVAALETVARTKDRKPVVIPLIGANLGETSGEAVARHVVQHGPLPEVDDDGVNVIVIMPVEPKAGGSES